MAPLTGPFGGHIDQIGIIVRDLETAMDAYAQSIGATFQVFEVDQSNSSFSGSSAEYRTRFAVALVGMISVELIQPVSGSTIHSDFLAQHGPGIHHLGIYVPDLAEASFALGNLGCRSILEGEIGELGRFAYFDSPYMACIVEALELASSFPLFLLQHATTYETRRLETGA